jgi:chorismate mutase
MMRAIRGAVQVDRDDKEAIGAAVLSLLGEIFDRNQIEHDDLISIIFTATSDLVAEFPAAAARALGLGDVPLLCAQELSIDGAMPRVIRVLVHAESALPREAITHVYLGGAAALRQDLAQ